MKELRAESFDELTDGRTNGSDYYRSDFFKRKGDINSVLNNSPVMLGKERKGSLTLAMGKCLCFSVKIKVCQSSLSSP